MTRREFLDAFTVFTEDTVKGILLPVQWQKEDAAEPKPRAAAVYKMRLVKSSAATKAAPYIIHQIITGKDVKLPGARQNGRVTVRSIFAVYNEDEQAGALQLLDLMEALREALLTKAVLENKYQIDLETGLETLIYPNETFPFYSGEMISTWLMKSVERETFLDE